MCIIAVKTQTSKHPSEECLRTMWNKNPDGAGFAYPDVNGGITVVKGLMTYEAFRAAIDPLLSVEGSFYLVHFRIRTHGSAGPENTHPFWVKDNEVAIAHNGILPYSRLVAHGEGRSDTSAFTEDILRHLPSNWWRIPHWQHVVEGYIGNANKLAVIDKTGIILFNTPGWNEDKETGLWFSNYGFRNYSAPAGGSQAQNFRQPTQTTTGNRGTGTGAGGTKQPTSYVAGRQEARNKYCRRVAQFVAAKILSHHDGIILRNQVITFNDWIPEEGEDFLDMIMEYYDARGEKKPVDIKDIMKLLGAERTADIPDCMAAMSYKLDPQGKQQVIETEDDDTKLIEFPKSDFNRENTKHFIGKMVTFKLIGGTRRYGVVTEVDAAGVVYSIAGGGTGSIAYYMIDEINTALSLTCPHQKDLQRHMGCRVIVETLVKTHAFDGVLEAVGPKGLTVHSDMGLHVTALYDEILTVTIVEDPKPKANTAHSN